MRRLRRTGVCIAVSGALCAGTSAYSQITTDGTLGAARALSGPSYAIPADLGRQAGSNLFHSFGVFNVPTAGSAIFAGPGAGAPPVSNVISRVTGGQVSSIDGRLGLDSSIHGANLFLINPRGILFGPSASLDLTGSFTASTANYLKLADGTRFEATATANPILTSAPPAAFGFLGATGPITVQGSPLQVAAGQSINLVGGPITVTGASLRTIAGDIRIVGTGGAGEVSLGGDVTPGMALAPVLIQRSALSTESADGAPPGRILIRGGRLTVLASSLDNTNYEQTDSPPVELAASGDLTVSASKLTSGTGGSGRGADLVLEGENVTVDHNSQVGSLTWGDGDGGNVTLSARNAVRVVAAAEDPNYTNVYSWAFWNGAGGDIRLRGDTVTVQSGNVYSYAEGSGKGGSIDMRGREVGVTSGAWVYTYNWWDTPGHTGDVDIVATQRSSIGGLDWFGNQSFVFTQTLGTGHAGTVRISAPALDVIGGIVTSFTYAGGNAGNVRFEGDVVRMLGGNGGVTKIESGASNFTTGDGGNVEIRATREFELDGTGFPSDWTRIGATTQGTGRGGDIIIEAPRISIEDGSLFSRTRFGTGEQGGITLRGNEVRLRNGGEIGTLTEGDRKGSFILIEARAVDLSDTSVIYATTGGSGDAGQVTINAERIRMTGASSIQANSHGGTGNAGGIVLNASESFQMTDRQPVKTRQTWWRSDDTTVWPGGLIAQASALGSAGRILVRAPNVLLDDGRILTTALGSGQGGRVEVQAGDLVMRNGAQIDARSAEGSSGDAGSIELAVTGELVLSGRSPVDGTFSGLYAQTRGGGRGGNVTLSASRINILDGGRIEATSTGTGAAGSISIAASDALRLFGGTISSEALNADGGNIDIRVGNLVHLKGSEITTAVGSGQGAGGNIFIDPTFVILENSKITANAFGGPGGNIKIFATYFLNTLDSLVDASSSAGLPGTVSISSPNTNLSTQLKVLPAAFFDATQLVREACSGRGVAGGGRSSLVGVGRGGLAASPERFATSTYFADAPTAVSSVSAPAGLKLVTAKQARLVANCAG